MRTLILGMFLLTACGKPTTIGGPFNNYKLADTVWAEIGYDTTVTFTDESHLKILFYGNASPDGSEVTQLYTYSIKGYSMTLTNLEDPLPIPYTVDLLQNGNMTWKCLHKGCTGATEEFKKTE